MTTTQYAGTKKAAGFYMGIIAALLCLGAAAMYGLKFSAISYKEPVFNAAICILLCGTAGISIILLFIRKADGFAPVLLSLGSGIGLLMYGKMMIWPISDTIYGIEPFPYMNEVTVCAVLLALSFVFSEISLYMKKTKDA